MDPELDQFLKDRKKAFETFTEDSIKVYCKKYGINVPERVFWLSCHKARVNMTDVDIKCVYESALWLQKNGYSHHLYGEIIGALEEAGYELLKAS